MELKFVLEKETKGAFMLTEVDDAGNKKTMGYVVGSLYVRKEFCDGTPRDLTMTLSGPQLKTAEPTKEEAEAKS